MYRQREAHNSQSTKAMWQKSVRDVRLCLARSHIKRGGYERGRLYPLRERHTHIPRYKNRQTNAPHHGNQSRSHTHTHIHTQNRSEDQVNNQQHPHTHRGIRYVAHSPVRRSQDVRRKIPGVRRDVRRPPKFMHHHAYARTGSNASATLLTHSSP